MKTKSLFNNISETCRPKETLKLYAFKPKMGTPAEDEIETVIATSIGHAIEQRPDLIQYYIHSITK